jgi:hypothetical protein
MPEQLDLFAEPPARIATEPERIAGGCAERPIVTQPDSGPSRMSSTDGLSFPDLVRIVAEQREQGHTPR